jgi:uroporphyrinogen decarboxylase
MKNEMNHRERILAAMDHRPVDRVPTDIWATVEVWEKLRARFGSVQEIRDALHIDGMDGVGTAYCGPSLPPERNGEVENWWGMRHKLVKYVDGAYYEQTFYPLAAAKTVDDLEKHRWPSADWFDYSKLREGAAKIRQTHAVAGGSMTPFFLHNQLRGFEASLVDPLEEPEFTHHLLRRIGDFLYEHHRRMFEACDGLIDVAQVTDDLGSQTGPLISLPVYREFYAPWHRKFIDLCHQHGIRAMHHDDGSMRAFLPDLVEMGLNILNPVQWTCPGMDMKELKRDFGRKLCFHGAVENQKILPFGTPEEVRAEVRHCIDALASDQTGYILAPCHNLQPNTPMENILAMYDEAWNYGGF